MLQVSATPTIAVTRPAADDAAASAASGVRTQRGSALRNQRRPLRAPPSPNRGVRVVSPASVAAARGTPRPSSLPESVAPSVSTSPVTSALLEQPVVSPSSWSSPQPPLVAPPRPVAPSGPASESWATALSSRESSLLWVLNGALVVTIGLWGLTLQAQRQATMAAKQIVFLEGKVERLETEVSMLQAFVSAVPATTTAVANWVLPEDARQRAHAFLGATAMLLLLLVVRSCFAMYRRRGVGRRHREEVEDDERTVAAEGEVPEAEARAAAEPVTTDDPERRSVGTMACRLVLPPDAPNAVVATASQTPLRETHEMGTWTPTNVDEAQGELLSVPVALTKRATPHDDESIEPQQLYVPNAATSSSFIATATSGSASPNRSHLIPPATADATPTVSSGRSVSTGGDDCGLVVTPIPATDSPPPTASYTGAQASMSRRPSRGTVSPSSDTLRGLLDEMLEDARDAIRRADDQRAALLQYPETPPPPLSGEGHLSVRPGEHRRSSCGTEHPTQQVSVGGAFRVCTEPLAGSSYASSTGRSSIQSTTSTAAASGAPRE